MNLKIANSTSQHPWVPQVSHLRPEKPQFSIRTLLFFALLLVAGRPALTQTADQAWLNYRSAGRGIPVPAQVRGFADESPVGQSAERELKRGIAGLVGGTLREMFPAYHGQTIVGTAAEIRSVFPNVPIPADLQPESYWLYRNGGGNKSDVIVAGADDRGALYGAFALLRLLATGEDLTHLNLRDKPTFKIRWVDEWDNPDGSIERGYAGRSIFFEGGNVRADLAPVSEYGRLLASVGINGLNVNNVNAAPQLIDSDHLKQIARIADALRPWGVRLAMSVAIASPQAIGGLSTYDPLDPKVKAWWASKADEIYSLIPDFAGFTVKADSEGQPGPASFGRTPADAANTLAAALAPHGGVVLYRAFVYNHHLDWRDPKADRARAAYDIFHPLDGKFLPNVIVQTKEGPIDFQVREPVSPLFAGLEHTSQAMEVQITQEYTGQQRHLVYLAPMWKWVLDTDLRANNQPTPVKEILADKTFHRAQTQPGATAPAPTDASNRTVSGHDFSRAASRSKSDRALAPAEMPLGGMVGVAGIGRDHWLSSPLALANLYAFGRLAWNPNLDPAEIAAEWTEQTISTDPEVVHTVTAMLMQSWPRIRVLHRPARPADPHRHHRLPLRPQHRVQRAKRLGPMARCRRSRSRQRPQRRTGSGFAGQYPPELAKLYEDRRHHPRRSAALLPSRAVHVPTARRKNCNSGNLRPPLRRRRASRALRR